MTYTIAPFDEGRLAQLHQIWQAAARCDRCREAMFREKVIEDKDVTSVVARLDDQLVGFGVGVTRRLPSERRGYIKMVAVAPSHQRQGIGSDLLANLESTLINQQVNSIRVAESAPNYLTPGIDATNNPALGFFAKHGYVTIGEAINQRVRLNQPLDTHADERRLRAEGVQLSRAALDHRAALDDFLDPHWPTWRDEIARAFQNDPISLHLALAGERVIGFSAYDANNVGTGWFGPMGTDPQFRGQGIGEVLLKRCLSDLRDQGHETATIPWVGPTGFYERLVGATVSRRFVRMEKQLVTG